MRDFTVAWFWFWKWLHFGFSETWCFQSALTPVWVQRKRAIIHVTQASTTPPNLRAGCSPLTFVQMLFLFNYDGLFHLWTTYQVWIYWIIDWTYISGEKTLVVVLSFPLLTSLLDANRLFFSLRKLIMCTKILKHTKRDLCRAPRAHWEVPLSRIVPVFIWWQQISFSWLVSWKISSN